MLGDLRSSAKLPELSAAPSRIMEQSQLLAHCGSSKITREELKVIPTPPGSPTHQPIPHCEDVGPGFVFDSASFRVADQPLSHLIQYRELAILRQLSWIYGS
jgi:hypothetical protein